MLRDVREHLDLRNVRAIVVAPIRWRGAVIGAIFLRTERDAAPFSESDVRFCQVVASLTAKALRNAHRFDAMVRATQDSTQAQRRTELQRIALISFRATAPRSVCQDRRSCVGGNPAAERVR